MAIRFFITTATHLLPEITSVYMCSLHSSHDGSGVHHSLSGTKSLHAYCFPREGLSFGHYCFGQKASISSLYHFDHLIQIGQIHCLACKCFSSELKSSACQHANNLAILDPIKETIKSLISLPLITLMILLMVTVPTVISTQDPQTVESSVTRAT